MVERAKQQKIKSETGQNHGNSSSFTPDDNISKKKKRKIKHETGEYHGNSSCPTPDDMTSKKKKKKIKSETGEMRGNLSSPTLDDTASKKKKKKPREEHVKVEEERSSKKKKKRKHKDPEDNDIGESPEVDKEGFESSCAESYSKKKKKHKNKKKTGLEETAGTAEAEYSSKLKEAMDTEEVGKSGDPEKLEADVYSHVRKKIKKSREHVREGSDEQKDSTDVSEKQEEKKRKKKRKRSGFGDSKGTEISEERATEEENDILTKGQRGTYVPSSEEKIPVSHNKKKRVSFSDVIEILGADSEKKSLQDAALQKAISLGWRHQDENPEPLRGKRFTPEEDEALRLSVALYVMEKGYDMQDGIQKVMNRKPSRDLSQCWKAIASVLPWRPVDSIRYRAHMLYERSAERGWTKDEIEALTRLQSIHGNKWKVIGDILGKSRVHVKDTWRRFKRENVARGSSWTQEEYSKLFHLVSKCLRLKNQLGEEQPTSRRLRDNLNWEAIADCMGTRDHVACCKKWYYSLASPMIETGEWANEDDYTLVKSLGEAGASDAEAVDWNRLVAGRSGGTCRKRWSQMVKHLGEQRTKPFPEQLETIARRYAPDLIE